MLWINKKSFKTSCFGFQKNPRARLIDTASKSEFTKSFAAGHY